MSSRLLVYLVTALGLLAAFEVGSVVGDGNYFMAGLILIVMVLVAGFSLFGKEASLEARVLTLLFAGYLIMGRGFAYITPAPPVYIGELTLAFLGLAYILRVALSQVDRYGPPSLTFVLLAILVYAGAKLVVVDFPKYGMTAVRDFATEYYLLYFFASYLAFKDEGSRTFFLGKLRVALFPAIVGMIIFQYIPEVMERAEGFSLFGNPIFQPHIDILIPVFCASVVWIGLGINGDPQRSTLRLILAVSLAAMLLPGSKVAAMTSLLGVFIFLWYAGHGRFVMRFVSGGVIAVVMLALILNSVYLFGNSQLSMAIRQNVETRIASMNPNNIVSSQGRSGRMETGSTKEWRVNWWRKIKSDVDANNPVFGLGLGADITTPFLQEYYGSEVISENDLATMARYPHNIIFAILGRLGYLGVLMWGVFFYLFVRQAFRAAKQASRKQAVAGSLIAWSFVIAGFCNSFVQSTFENPYAGIPFWIILGLAYRLYEAGQARLYSSENESGTGPQTESATATAAGY